MRNVYFWIIMFLLGGLWPWLLFNEGSTLGTFAGWGLITIALYFLNDWFAERYRK